MKKRPYDPVKRRAYTLARFGLTQAEYDEQLRAQGGVCAICFKPPKEQRLHVDHDHRTKRLRGLVHYQCNRAIGRGIDPVTFRRIADYLERPAWQTERYMPKRAARRRRGLRTSGSRRGD